MAAAGSLCSRLLRPLCTCTKTTLLGAITARSFRLIQTSSLCGAGQRFRERKGLARSGNEYGPLTDLPDWSYLDGTPAPPSARRLKREAKRKAISSRIQRLMKQVDEAQLKEVYDELGMPYEPKTKGYEAETVQEEEDTTEEDIEIATEEESLETTPEEENLERTPEEEGLRGTTDETGSRSKTA